MLRKLNGLSLFSKLVVKSFNAPSAVGKKSAFSVVPKNNLNKTEKIMINNAQTFGNTTALQLATPSVYSQAKLLFGTKKDKDQSSSLLARHIPPDVAQRIYFKVNALGERATIDALDNINLPNKFAKALDILGIQCWRIGFRGYDGYVVLLDQINLARIEDISNITLMCVSKSEEANIRKEPALENIFKEFEKICDVTSGNSHKYFNK